MEPEKQLILSHTPGLEHCLNLVAGAKTPEETRAAHEALGQYVARVYLTPKQE